MSADCTRHAGWQDHRCTFCLDDALTAAEGKVKVLEGWKRNAEKGMGSDSCLPEEMYKLELEAQLTWDTAIEEAGKERIVFIAKDDILSMDRDMKIRKQMRDEIVQALQMLKAEAQP